MLKSALAMVTLSIALVRSTAAVTAPAPETIVTCDPPTGVNLASATEKDRSNGAVPEAFDAAAGGYVSHPRNTNRWTLEIFRGGTAIDTEFFSNGDHLQTTMRRVGKEEQTSSSYVIDGSIGTNNLVTLYPKEGLAIVVATGYFGYKTAVPSGSVYISRCRFSHSLN